jgi:hypothetical protein
MLFGLIEMLNMFLNVPGKVMSPLLAQQRSNTLKNKY